MLVDELSGRPARRPRYNAEQVQEIVGRAAQLEAVAPTASGAMTLGGVEALGAEVGIAPERIRAAAATMRRPESGALALADPTARNPWINGPSRIAFERIVEGELPESEYATLVDEIRHLLKNGGQVSQLGKSFTWSPTRSQTVKRELEVVVTVRGGKTRITVIENLANLIGGVFGGICGGMGGGGMAPMVGITMGAIGLSPLFLIGLIPGWLAAAYGTARAVYQKQSRKRAGELAELADRLAEVTRDLIGAA
jgi:hypothetical protein